MSVTKPSIEDLLGETNRLVEKFRELRERYPDSLVFRYILSMHWRPDVGKTVTEPDVEAGIEYTAALGKYLGNLSRFFVDWMEQPERFERFPLSRYFKVYKSMESTEPEEFLAHLKFHEDLLLIEQSKQQGEAQRRTDVKPKRKRPSSVPRKLTKDNLPRFLKMARGQGGDTQKTAAKKCCVKLATYKSWEQGRHFPLLETRKFAEDYIRLAVSGDAREET